MKITVSNNTNFEKCEIDLFRKSDIAPFVKKILSDSNVSQQIITKVNESEEFDFSVLDTPLMISWFILVYKRRLKIPKTRLGFYEDLFSVILSRHDGLKDSYNRPSRTRLTDDEIKTVFSALCFVSRKDQKRVFSEQEIVDYIRQALNISEFKSVKRENYLYDLTHVTCLIKKDGIEYEFIHESITQYFSSLFLKNQVESNAKKFYLNRVGDWRKYEGELGFLYHIDKMRFLTYFYIPSLIKMLNKNGKIKSDNVFDVYSSAIVLRRRHGSSRGKNVRVLAPPIDDYAMRIALGSNRPVHENSFLSVADEYLKVKIFSESQLEVTLNKIFGGDSAKSIGDYVYCSFLEVLESLGKVGDFFDFVEPSFTGWINKELSKTQSVVDAENNKESLFS